MDFTIKLKDGTNRSFRDVRGISILDGVWHVHPKGHKKKIEVMAADIDVVVGHVHPVQKLNSVIVAANKGSRLSEKAEVGKEE